MEMLITSTHTVHHTTAAMFNIKEHLKLCKSSSLLLEDLAYKKKIKIEHVNTHTQQKQSLREVKIYQDYYRYRYCVCTIITLISVYKLNYKPNSITGLTYYHYYPEHA